MVLLSGRAVAAATAAELPALALGTRSTAKSSSSHRTGFKSNNGCGGSSWNGAGGGLRARCGVVRTTARRPRRRVLLLDAGAVGRPSCFSAQSSELLAASTATKLHTNAYGGISCGGPGSAVVAVRAMAPRSVQRRRGGKGEAAEEEVVFESVADMRAWLRTKPKGFAAREDADTSVEDRLLAEIAAAEAAKRKAAAARERQRKEGAGTAPRSPPPRSTTAGAAAAAPAPLPPGVRVRLWGLPKKRNVERDLASALRGGGGSSSSSRSNGSGGSVRGLLHISVSTQAASAKTREPVCSGSALLTFSSEGAARSFVKQYSNQPIVFGKVSKAVKCTVIEASLSSAPATAAAAPLAPSAESASPYSSPPSSASSSLSPLLRPASSAAVLRLLKAEQELLAGGGPRGSGQTRARTDAVTVGSLPVRSASQLRLAGSPADSDAASASGERQRITAGQVALSHVASKSGSGADEWGAEGDDAGDWSSSSDGGSSWSWDEDGSANGGGSVASGDRGSTGVVRAQEAEEGGEEEDGWEYGAEAGSDLWDELEDEDDEEVEEELEREILGSSSSSSSSSSRKTSSGDSSSSSSSNHGDSGTRASRDDDAVAQNSSSTWDRVDRLPPTAAVSKSVANGMSSSAVADVGTTIGGGEGEKEGGVDVYVWDEDDVWEEADDDAEEEEEDEEDWSSELEVEVSLVPSSLDSPPFSAAASSGAVTIAATVATGVAAAAAAAAAAGAATAAKPLSAAETAAEARIEALEQKLLARVEAESASASLLTQGKKKKSKSSSTTSSSSRAGVLGDRGSRSLSEWGEADAEGLEQFFEDALASVQLDNDQQQLPQPQQQRQPRQRPSAGDRASWKGEGKGKAASTAGKGRRGGGDNSNSSSSGGGSSNSSKSRSRRGAPANTAAENSDRLLAESNATLLSQIADKYRQKAGR